MVSMAVFYDNFFSSLLCQLAGMSGMSGNPDVYAQIFTGQAWCHIQLFIYLPTKVSLATQSLIAFNANLFIRSVNIQKYRFLSVLI
jgi:hypothetical protein